MNTTWESLIYLYNEEHKEFLTKKIDSIVRLRGTNLLPADFTHLDIMHPSEHLGVSNLIAAYPLTSRSLVLDVGCGIGGTSRFIEQRTSCKVYSIDYLQHFVDIAELITGHTGQSRNIEYHQGDITSAKLEPGKFDLALAIGVFLIVQGTTSFENIRKSLKQNGLFYIEDYMLHKERDQMTPEEVKEIESFAMPGIRSARQLNSELEATGFEIIETCDFSKEWSVFAWTRSEGILSKYYNGSPEDKPDPQEVENYARQSPKLLCHLKHLGKSYVQQLFPLTLHELGDFEVIFTHEPLVLVQRILARRIN